MQLCAEAAALAERGDRWEQIGQAAERRRRAHRDDPFREDDFIQALLDGGAEEEQ